MQLPDNFRRTNKQNDTASIILNFTDNYAYDDGTPEFGFGIPAPSTEGALLPFASGFINRIP